MLYKKWSKPLASALLLALLLASTLSSGIPAPTLAAEPASPQLANGVGLKIFVPVIRHSFPNPPSQFGVDMTSISVSHGLDLASSARVTYVRFNLLNWSAIEPERTNPPTYHWNVVSEGSLINASQRGMRVIGVVHYTPSWAQMFPGYSCGPVVNTQLAAFAQFMQAAVRRYSAPPYNVKVWELINEPDVDPSQAPVPNSVFGCWGNLHDPYFGGGYYADMLKQVYPAIKAADPQSQVLVGGLLLDCDPTHPPKNKTCTPSKFLEGILKNGGGAYMDGVAFHGYPTYYGSLQNDPTFPSWDARGGIVLGKISFLREVMARYGVNLPIWDTEGALLCQEGSADCDSEAFKQAQADYAVWLYVRNWAAGVKATTWFAYDFSWRGSGMLNPDMTPKPVYDSFNFMTQELYNATYLPADTTYPGSPNVARYEFSASGKTIWVVWSRDEQTYSLPLPAGTTRVVDKYGVPVPIVGSSISLKSPVYIELNP